MFQKSAALLSCALLMACAAQPSPKLSIADLPALPDYAFGEDEQSLAPDQLKEDLTALYSGLQEAHYDLYARQSKEAYDELYASLLSELDTPLKPTEALIIFQRFAAFGNIAHARVEGTYAIWGRYREASGKALPIYPRIRGEKVFVAESYDPAVRPGDQILALNGLPMAEWLPRLYRNTSADNDYLHSSLLEQTFPLDLLIELGPQDSFSLSIKTSDGVVRDVEVAAITSETLQGRDQQEGGDYFVFDGSGRSAEMLDGKIAYLKPGAFYGAETPENPWDPSAFWTFIDESFTTFLEEDAAALIIDMRKNPGGDNSFSDRMISWFADEPFRFYSKFSVRSSAQSQASNQARIDLNPASADGPSGELAKLYAATPYGETFDFDLPFARPHEGDSFEGPVYAIVDRYSYSNAVNVASLLQDYGMATIVGEETSDLATSYGSMETFTLPNSGLTVGFPKSLIIRPSGDISDRGVVPDVALEVPVFSKTDTVLEQTIELVRSEITE